MAAILKKGIRNPLGISNGFLARSNELKKIFISLLGKFITLFMILLHYREVLHYREFITLLEQNIIIDLFQDIPLVFMAAILKIIIRTPLGILNGFLARSNDLKKMFIAGSITLSGVYYIITLLEQNIIIDIFQYIPLVLMAAILKIIIRIPLGILNGS